MIETTNLSSFGTVDPVVTVIDSSRQRDVSFFQLAHRFQQAARSSSKSIDAVVAMTVSEVGALVGVVCQRGGDGQFLPSYIYCPATESNVAKAMLPELLAASRESSTQQRLVRKASASSTQYELLAVPLPNVGRSGALALCLPSDSRVPNHVVPITLCAAAYLGLAEATQSPSEPPAFIVDDSARLVKIVSNASAAASMSEAFLVLVNELQDWLGCDCVSLALIQGASDARIIAISRVATFDKRSALAAALEAAAREVMLRGQLQVFSSSDESAVPSIFQELLGAAGCNRVWAWPWKDSDGKPVAVCFAMWSSSAPERGDLLPLISRSVANLAATTCLLRRAHEPSWQRASRSILSALRLLRRRRLLTVAMLTVVLVLCLPWRYYLPCECVVEPLVRRFVTAPFDSVLDRALVGPGDRVQANDKLALLDGRELAMLMASRQASLDQARQRYQAALAKRDAVGSKLAMMEVQQLEQEVELCIYRRENLAISSPLTGIVVSGDLHRLEGAPLSVGQKLFEVAPLDQMVFETSVPEKHVNAVAEGAAVVVRLDAHPGVKLQGSISRLHPQAELRGQNSVFIAEIAVDSAPSSLLPGMSGQAHIDAGYRSIAWILFHRPWRYLRAKVVW